MMPRLSTPVGVEPLPVSLGLDSRVVSLGSCFADEVGRRMQDAGICVELNPFGTLYNPASVASALARIVADAEITPADLVLHDGLWHSWHHHGSFSRASADDTLALCNAAIHRAHRALLQADVLIVTFGTAWVYELVGSCQQVVDSGQPTNNYQLITTNYQLPTKIVANCHKLPPTHLVRRRMSVGEIVSLWQPLLRQLRAVNPRLSAIFTVSPIRHMADGAHAGQLSKATLLLAVDEIVSSSKLVVGSEPPTNNYQLPTNNPQLSTNNYQLPTNNYQLSTTNHQLPTPSPTCYFPAYEIVLDELRDYRFYGPDMAHPTPLAVDIVWEYFQQATMSPATRQQAHNRAKQARRAAHVPLHPNQG